MKNIKIFVFTAITFLLASNVQAENSVLRVLKQATQRAAAVRSNLFNRTAKAQETASLGGNQPTEKATPAQALHTLEAELNAQQPDPNKVITLWGKLKNL